MASVRVDYNDGTYRRVEVDTSKPGWEQRVKAASEADAPDAKGVKKMRNFSVKDKFSKYKTNFPLSLKPQSRQTAVSGSGFVLSIPFIPIMSSKA